MAAADIGQRWPGLSEAVSTGIREWRLQNPKATFSEIERELDLRLAKLRARMLQDAALAGSATDWSGNPPGAKPACPDCGAEPVSWGKRRRRLPTLGGPEVTLERRYGVCPAGGGDFSPLDAEPELLPGRRTPGLEQIPARLGSWMPFAPAQGFLVDWMKLNSRTEFPQCSHGEAAYRSGGGGIRGHLRGSSQGVGTGRGTAPGVVRYQLSPAGGGSGRGAGAPGGRSMG